MVGEGALRDNPKRRLRGRLDVSRTATESSMFLFIARFHACVLDENSIIRQIPGSNLNSLLTLA